MSERPPWWFWLFLPFTAAAAIYVGGFVITMIVEMGGG